ncbi:MAG: histone deacetylase [Chloroflexota bacterium]
MRELGLFYPTGHEQHSAANHPERPERVEAIRKALEVAELWEEEFLLPPIEVPEKVLKAIHTPGHLQSLKSAADYIDADTYLTAASGPLAFNAAGGGIAIADAVWTRQVKRGFALTRPPGHHATPNEAMGFCLLNNIALAAEYLLQKHKAERIAIVDIDLHHGNGTQDIFYQRGDVFFCSIHQYPLFPMTGVAAEIGSDQGEGLTLNIPYPPYAGDFARMTALEQAVMPALEAFAPEMLLISAGFDAHWRDPLGHQLATAQGYGEIIDSFTQFADAQCDGRIAIFLEGGYDLEAGAVSALAATQAILGLKWDDPLGRGPTSEDEYWKTRLAQVLSYHQD